MMGVQKCKFIPNIWNGLYSSIRPYSFRPVLLKLPHAHKSCGGNFAKIQVLEWGLRSCISNVLPREANALDPWTTV